MQKNIGNNRSKIDIRSLDYVVITPFFPSEGNYRGCYVYDFVKALERSANFRKVIVFVPTPKLPKNSVYEYDGIHVHLFKAKEMPSYLFNGVFNSVNAKNFIRAFHKAGYRAEDVAIAHAHVSSNAAAALALKRLNPKIVTLLHHHDADPYTVRNGKFAGNLLNLFIRAKINVALFKKIDLHVCVSRYVEYNLQHFPNDNPADVIPSYLKRLKTARLLRIPEPKIKRTAVLYNGVDIKTFFPNPKKAAGVFTIGCIGNFVELKDHITLIKAVERLSVDSRIGNIRVKMVGTGPTLESCKQYVENHNLTDIIEFLPEVKHECLNEFYNSLDLFVLPSYYEGFGCVLTEAAACGVPFITCSNAGGAEYLTDDQFERFTIPPGDVKALAERLMMAINRPMRQKLNYEYDINVLVNNFIDKYLSSLFK